MKTTRGQFVSMEANRVSALIILKCLELHHIQQITAREVVTALNTEAGEAAAAGPQVKVENILNCERGWGQERSDKKKFRGADESADVCWQAPAHQILFLLQELHDHREDRSFRTVHSESPETCVIQFSNINFWKSCAFKLRNVFTSSSGSHLAEPTWRHHKGPLALFLCYFQRELNQISWCWVSPAPLHPHEE